MKILVFADLHYYGGDVKNFNSERKLVEFAVPILNELIQTAQREQVCAVVNLGDIIQDAGNKESDIKSLEYMFGCLKEFKCPCYSVLGNHDLKMMDSLKDVEPIMGCDSSRYSVDIGGFHLVFLTTDVMPELGTARGGSYKTQNLSQQGLEWLKNDLENNNLPSLLFTHFPLVYDEAVRDECGYMKNREDVKEIIRADKNIRAVFSGHCHTPKVLEENGIKHYVVGSPTTSLKADGIPMGVYRIIETVGDDIITTEHRIVL